MCTFFLQKYTVDLISYCLPVSTVTNTPSALAWRTPWIPKNRCTGPRLASTNLTLKISSSRLPESVAPSISRLMNRGLMQTNKECLLLLIVHVHKKSEIKIPHCVVIRKIYYRALHVFLSSSFFRNYISQQVPITCH